MKYFMNSSKKIMEKSDSLIKLLTDQCADLEKLLALARQEKFAAESGEFEEVFNIVSERMKVSNRLELFQRQISELRDYLGGGDAAKLTTRIVEIANLTMEQDKQTKLLLASARENTAVELTNLEKSQRGTKAYLREDKKGLVYERDF